MTTLITILSELRDVGEIIAERGGEVPPNSDLEARYLRCCEDLATKTDAIATHLLEREGAREAKRAALAKIKASIDAEERADERFKDFVKRLMGEKTILQGEVYDLKVKKCPPRVEILEPHMVKITCPEAVTRTPLEVGTYEVSENEAGNVVYLLGIDKQRLKEALRDGKGVQGAVLVQGTRLDIG